MPTALVSDAHQLPPSPPAVSWSPPRAPCSLRRDAGGGPLWIGWAGRSDGAHQRLKLLLRYETVWSCFGRPRAPPVPRRSAYASRRKRHTSSADSMCSRTVRCCCSSARRSLGNGWQPFNHTAYRGSGGHVNDGLATRRSAAPPGAYNGIGAAQLAKRCDVLTAHVRPPVNVLPRVRPPRRAQLVDHAVICAAAHRGAGAPPAGRLARA